MNLMNCNVTKYYSGDQIKKKEIILAWNTEGANSGDVYTVFWWGNHWCIQCFGGETTWKNCA